MAERHIGEAVRRVAQQVAAADLNAVWGRVQQDPVDEAALRELVDRWGPGFLGYCRAVLRDAHAAEDVVSASFAVLIRKRAVPADAESALRYLWKTVARSARRVRSRAARRPDRTPLDASTPPADARDPDPAANAVRAEAAADIAAALTQLSENERSAVVLVSFLDHTEEGAAQVLGCSRASVRTYLSRAKEKLGRLLVRYKDAVGAAGGVATVDAALTEAARAASIPTPTAALVESILRQAAAPVKSVSGWAKAAVVLLILGAAGGVTLAMWPVPEPAPPPVGAVNPPPPTPPVESVPARNQRIFSTEVLPRQLAALKKLVPEGEVVLRTVDVFDVRVNCEYELRHTRNEPRGLVSALRFEHISYMTDKWPRQGRTTTVYWDRLNHRKWETVSPEHSRSLILWQNPPWTRKVISIVVGSALQDAVAAFDSLPSDVRARAEFVQTLARMKAAAAPYLGTWYVRGDPRQSRQIELEDKGEVATGQVSGVLFRGVLPPAPDWVPLYVRGSTRVGPDGRLIGLNYYVQGAYHSPDGHAVTLSGDGQRLDFEETGEWWTRNPLPQPSK